MTAPAGLKHLPALTGFRFFLAVWVILHHLTGTGQSLGSAALSLPHGLYSLIRGGYLAVTTFFVLSGFVLARSYPKCHWTGSKLVKYGIGRVARVYPVYLLSFLVVAPMVAADSIPGKSWYVLQYLSLVQAWFPGYPAAWNTPAWSLSCEMFFYLMFPLLAAMVLRMNWRGTILTAVVAVLLTRAMWAAGIPDGVKPLIHLSDFLMGIAASRVYDLVRVPRGEWLYLPALAISAVLIAYQQLLPPHVDLNTALRPLNAVLLIGLAAGGGVVARVLSTRPIVFLGKASYAMYILHVPILWWYPRVSSVLSALIYVAVVIAVSALVYRFVEEPANRRLRSR